MIKRIFAWLKRMLSFWRKKKEEPGPKPAPGNSLVKIRLSNQITIAELVQNNIKTIWVRLLDGHIIKRHKIKHVVN